MQWLNLLAQAEPPNQPWLPFWVPLVVIGVMFYLMLVRPERRKRAELSQLLNSLKKNDRVVTIGGIYGTIVNAQQGSEEVTIRVDETNNTKLHVRRSAISQVIEDKERPTE
jgi:preprotein translocase subunit YajC